MRFSLSKLHDYWSAKNRLKFRRPPAESRSPIHPKQGNARVVTDTYAGDVCSRKQERSAFSHALPEPVPLLAVEQPQFAFFSYRQSLAGLSWEQRLERVPTLEQFAKIPCIRTGALHDCATSYIRASEASKDGFDEQYQRKGIAYLWLAAVDESSDTAAFCVAADLELQIFRLLAFRTTGHFDASSGDVYSAPKSPQDSQLVDELGNAALHLLDLQLAGTQVSEMTTIALLMTMQQGTSVEKIERIARRAEDFLSEKNSDPVTLQRMRDLQQVAEGCLST